MAARGPKLDPARVAKWLAIVYAVPVALVVLVSAAWSLNLLVLIAALLGFAWQVAPVAVAAVFARRSLRARWAWTFVLLQVGIFGFALWIWYLLLVVDPDAQSPIALFIFVPLYEYAAVALFAAGATIFGWRMRDPGSEVAGTDG